MYNKKKHISNIESEKTESNIVLSSNSSGDILPFYKEDTYMLDNVSFIKFIKNVEYLVRTSKDYKSYIRYLKEELDPPLNRCMVYNNISDDMAKIEMHHFLFTLFDYIEIIIGWCFKNKVPFSSSKLSHMVMEEHRNHHVLVMMLSESVHVAIHNVNKKDSIRFLDYRMAHGNLIGFLNTYYDGLSFNHIAKLRNYFEQYAEYTKNPPESFFEEIITKWNNEVQVK